jgi:hypothetical protein
MNPDVEQHRNGNGGFAMTIDSAQLDAQAATLHAAGHTYRHIATTLGISLGSAYLRVQRALEKAVIPAATEAVEQIVTNLQADRARLHDLIEQLTKDLAEPKFMIDPADPDGPAIIDRDYTLKVAEQIRKLTDQLQKNDESLRKLLGLDQPTQAQLSGHVQYEIIGLDT